MTVPRPSRSRPRVQHTQSPVPFLDLLDAKDGDGSGHDGGTPVVALPEVNDDLDALRRHSDGEQLLAELRRFVERTSLRGLETVKRAGWRPAGDLSDIHKHKLDLPNRGKGQTPRFRVCLVREPSRIVVVAVAERRQMNDPNYAYTKCYLRLGRLPGWQLEDIGAELEQPTLLLDLTGGAKRDLLWERYEITQDPNEPEGAGLAESFWPLVAVTAYPVDGQGVSDSLTFSAYHAQQRYLDQALLDVKDWLTDRRIGFTEEQSTR